MGKETILFKSEEKRSIQEVAAFLRQLADKLETGQVILQQGQQELVLEIPSRVELEVKAEEETGKRKVTRSLEVEIEWVPGQEAEGGLMLG